ncbi:hypothetical protein [Nocardia higoensis]|uniref:hypothetical protein n=1 Tax=Nocardia higoensis TaxID=228599 RepID=UPI0014616617|nr:hypothetical protein [Nocardia higoensis]
MPHADSGAEAGTDRARRHRTDRTDRDAGYHRTGCCTGGSTERGSGDPGGHGADYRDRHDRAQGRSGDSTDGAANQATDHCSGDRCRSPGGHGTGGSADPGAGERGT